MVELIVKTARIAGTDAGVTDVSMGLLSLYEVDGNSEVL